MLSGTDLGSRRHAGRDRTRRPAGRLQRGLRGARPAVALERQEYGELLQMTGGRSACCTTWRRGPRRRPRPRPERCWRAAARREEPALRADRRRAAASSAARRAAPAARGDAAGRAAGPRDHDLAHQRRGAAVGTAGPAVARAVRRRHLRRGRAAREARPAVLPALPRSTAPRPAGCDRGRGLGQRPRGRERRGHPDAGHPQRVSSRAAPTPARWRCATTSSIRPRPRRACAARTRRTSTWRGCASGTTAGGRTSRRLSPRPNGGRPARRSRLPRRDCAVSRSRTRAPCAAPPVAARRTRRRDAGHRDQRAGRQQRQPADALADRAAERGHAAHAHEQRADQVRPMSPRDRGSLPSGTRAATARSRSRRAACRAAWRSRS